jgi:hypothetical protein
MVNTLYFAFIDEANQDSNKKFTVVGCVVFPTKNIFKLHNGIETIRKKYGFPTDSSLKSASANRPPNVTSEDHANAKNDVLKLCAQYDVSFICSLKFNFGKQNVYNNVTFGYNTVLLGLKKLLGNQGVAIVHFDKNDSFSKYFDFFKEKFQKGLTFQDGGTDPLTRILSYSMISDGSSHFSSIADIVTGALRFVVNEKSPKRDVVAELLLPLFAKDNNGTVKEVGLFLRPKERARLPKDVLVDYDEISFYFNKIYTKSITTKS